MRSKELWLVEKNRATVKPDSSVAPRWMKTYNESRIVEFRIPGYPGPSKESDMEVRLTRGKIFRGKIRMYLQTLCCF